MKKLTGHFIIVITIIAIALLLERLVHFNYGKLTNQPIVLNSVMAIKPVYNTDGSWVHGKWGIGYQPVLLFCENIIALLFAILISRYLMVFNTFFHMSMWSAYTVDLFIAVSLYRIISRFYSPYVLDYLYIRGQGTYDFADFCLGAGFICIIAWLFPAKVRYSRYKKPILQGKSLWQKLKWELKLTVKFYRAVFMKQEKWTAEFEKWE